jgi:hypothetical protein
MTTRPQVLPVLLESIPQDLKDIPRWVLWKSRPRKKPDGTKTWAKMPYAATGTPGSSTDAKTWCTYDEAADAHMLGDYDGLGFVLGEGLHGIDLDDCRDPITGLLSDLALEVLEKVQGYAEVSPSGTGIKIFTPTNLDGSRTKKEMGVELYRDGRYFTVTGHRINGHDYLPTCEQDLGWLVKKVWGDSLSPAAAALEGEAGERALAMYKPPLEGWDLDRVIQEVLLHLDPDSGYSDWLQVGQILHHQGKGDPEWCLAWDEWSANSGKWIDGYCAEKWDSFSQTRTQGRGVLTLASLIKQTKAKREAITLDERDQMMVQTMEAIASSMDARSLQEVVAIQVANTPAFSDVDREIIASAIQARSKDLGGKLPIAKVRDWLRPKSIAGIKFAYVNREGHPLCTLENLRTMLASLGYVVRYNVIKKLIEILIPGAVFLRDNRDNAAIAHVLSECEKVRMATKHISQYLITLADENPYNPVTTWIEALPWDGVSRLDAFFATVSAAGNPEFKNKLLRKWLLQAVASAFAPDGIPAQGILTFVGPQNIGKTTWFQRLAPSELDVILTGHTLDTRSKDSVFIALSFWLVELGEVDATMRKSDISALKSFVTQPVDKIRRPYAATESNFGRRTVFGATVNDQQFLHDPTGNRRFWTIEVDGFVLDHGIDMQQLWAEVLKLWQSGEKFNLDQAEVAELNEHNQAFTVADPIEELLLGKFNWREFDSWEWLTATEVLIKIGVTQPTKKQTITASSVLRKANGGRHRKSNGRSLLAVPTSQEVCGQ